MVASAASADYSKGYGNHKDFPKWYVGLQGSVSFLNETDLNISSGANSDLDFETGYGLGASLGYSPSQTQTLLDDMRFELEYYYRTNDLDELSQPGGSSQIGDDVSSENYMINAYYDFDMDLAVVPYVGAGAGISKIKLDAPAVAVDDDDNVFAYQLMAGIGWQPASLLNTVLHVGYRYFDASDPDFSGIGGARIDHEYEMHNIEAGARFKF